MIQIYYINKGDGNTLYSLNLKTGKEERLIKKNISSIQMDKNIMYYSQSNSIGIYKYDVLSGKGEQVTSVRTNEFVCIN